MFYNNVLLYSINVLLLRERYGGMVLSNCTQTYCEKWQEISDFEEKHDRVLR